MARRAMNLSSNSFRDFLMLLAGNFLLPKTPRVFPATYDCFLVHPTPSHTPHV